jgi:nucleoside diphosphate kinase
VRIEGSKKGSIFDQLEDLDSSDCLSKLKAISEMNLMNQAFVFIKPHAVTEKVKKLAADGLRSKKITILAEGSISGESIDEKKLIDQHYYAIASKATILKPSELNVPTDKFQAQFGLTWQAALDSGRVFNAMDGCKYLEINADELDKAWAKTKAAKKLVKFGGGFYCGLVEVDGKDPVYIFNGFFMSMRSKFTQPGTEIYYYSVEWDPNVLSWADFRGQVLGPTDPTDAPADSLRGQILASWKDLGLASEPNVGDNGMHASASPFEALAERNNWLGISIDDDNFGKIVLGAGLSSQRISAWSVDPQVRIEGSEKGSIFDQLEDLDSSDCLSKLKAISEMNLMNQAFVFIKPHAVTEKAKKLAADGLRSKKISILAEGSISGESIDEKKLIDQHYYAIASKATILKPSELNVPTDKFEAQFGLSWQAALDSGKVFNAMDGCKYLEINADELDKAWAKTKAAKKLVKFGGGFYCGLVEVDGTDPVYIFNGFFMSMRSKFTQPGTEIYYYTVEWDPTALSWADFRGKVLGPTDPNDAPADSLRGQMLARWKELGLSSEPNVGDNGMHASASPFEALAERTNWLQASIGSDQFGKQMLLTDMTEALIKAWSVDPQVVIAPATHGSIFDQLEDLDSTECLLKLAEVSKLNIH